MNNNSSITPQSTPGWAGRILQFSGVIWFLFAAIGQWIFVYYVAAFYGPLLVSKGLPGLDESHLPDGYVPGDTIGNLAIALHILIAIIIIGGGPLQLARANQKPLSEIPPLCRPDLYGHSRHHQPGWTLSRMDKRPSLAELLAISRSASTLR